MLAVIKPIGNTCNGKIAKITVLFAFRLVSGRHAVGASSPVVVLQTTWVNYSIFLYNTNYKPEPARASMGLTPKELAEMLKLRALGWNQKEIAEALDKSQQVIAYQLKKLKAASKKKGTDEVFNLSLIHI